MVGDTEHFGEGRKDFVSDPGVIAVIHFEALGVVLDRWVDAKKWGFSDRAIVPPQPAS